MLELKAILFFTGVVAGLGLGLFSLTGATRSRSPVVGVLEIAGAGVALFSFLGVVLAATHVPLRWPLYLGLAAVGPVVEGVRRMRGGAPAARGFSWDRKEAVSACVLIAVLAVFFRVYYVGATAYPYLEDTDPWKHAQGVLYVATQHTYAVDPLVRAFGGFAFYLEPYPPTFDVLLGVLRQIADSTSWTLKFFNVALVTLALALQYPFCSAYLGSRAKGLFATLLLAALPSFMSHFIWSQSLALCVFPVAAYATLRALEDPSWSICALVTIASLMVTQPVVSLMAGVVLIGILLALLWQELPAAKRFDATSLPASARMLVVGAAGLAVSFVYWGAQLAKWGLHGIFALKGDEFTTGWQDAYSLRQTTLAATIFPTGESDRIDQPVGWGLVVALALAIGLADRLLRLLIPLARSKRAWTDLHLVFWFAALAYVVFSPSLGLPAWGSARAWAYLAIPVALLATDGVFLLARLLGRSHPRLEPAAIVAGAVAIFATSAPAKLQVETCPWTPGPGWQVDQTEGGPVLVGMNGYARMRATLPPNTRVYAVCGGDGRSIGFDMESSPWDPDEAAFRRRGGNITPHETLRFLEEHRYPYFVFDVSCWDEWGRDRAESFARTIGSMSRVRTVLADQGFILAEIASGDAVAAAPAASSAGASP
jgi:hypothetical protein